MNDRRNYYGRNRTQYTPHEAAILLDVEQTQLNVLINQGKIRTRLINNAVHISLLEIKRYLLDNSND